MRHDVEPSQLMKQPRKRARAHNSNPPKAASTCNRPRFDASITSPPLMQQAESSLTTPTLTAAASKPTNFSSQQRQTSFEAEPQAHKQRRKAQSEPKRSKCALDDPTCGRAAKKRHRQSSEASEPQAAEPQGPWFHN
ncbi:hypothetical protein PV05_03302 [Exophiala xenobiotica]|uniref:Uncharacterized protein n=1 Tax=Exophiala xenobiotica TaxID=348802 RepID=A0A0D2EVL3_9EURO|nr:uncharacterized protein PV05_03302 [Exophiala xenobiotica]KIW58805.1 hypothetical protein PV05_03302 [Exophiala xenobiotica]